MLNYLQRQWFPFRRAARRPSALPLAVLLLALAAPFLFGNDRAYFYRFGHHDWNSSRTLAMAESLSLRHGLLGFHYLSRDAVGDRDYSRESVYGRFPLGGFALVKLAILPFGEDAFRAKIYAGRMLMLLLFSAAAVLAYHALARIIGSRWDALAATLLAFSSYYMLYYSDMIFNEVAIDFFAVMLVFHAMVIFVQERRFRQLLIKCCLALLLGWHIYAFLLPFIFFGLVAELIKSHQAFYFPTRISAAQRLRGYAIALLRSRYLTLGAVALLFGSAVLTFNLTNEYLALDRTVPVSELPSVQSAARRLGQNQNFNAIVARLVEPKVFVADQFYRIAHMTLPYALNPYEIKDRFSNFEYRDYPSIALGVLALGICLAGLVAVRRRPQTLQLLATLTFAGFCWAVPLRLNVHRHDYESIFYIGIPLTAFVLILLSLRKLSRIRVAPFLAAAALAVFVLSAAAMASVGQSSAEIAAESAELADYAAIRKLVDDDDAAIWIQQRPWIARNSGAPWDQPFFLAGKTLNYEDTDRDLPKVKQVGDYLLLNTREDNPALLTPENSYIFLYDWALYAAHHNETDWGKQIIGGDWRVYLANDRITYVSPECASRDEQFYLHLTPQNTADLSVNSKGRGYNNFVFAFHPTGITRSDGSCLLKRPLPGYDIAALRTGQRTPAGPIWQGEYRRPLP